MVENKTTPHSTFTPDEDWPPHIFQFAEYDMLIGPEIWPQSK